MEQRISRSNKQTEAALCRKDLDGQHKIIRIHSEENQFLRRNGDTVEKFSCPTKTAQLATTLDVCYQDIPLADGLGFVKPDTRILTQHSTPINTQIQRWEERTEK